LKQLSVDDLSTEIPRHQAQRVFDALHETTAAPAAPANLA
jgi:hypothetical protein